MEFKETYNELVLVNPEQYGIEKPKALELLGNLPLLKQERFVLEQEYNEVVLLDINDKKTAKIARELRLKIRDNRTKGIDAWHKNSKTFFLRGGQFVDAIKNMEVSVNQKLEETLEVIEKHFETQEALRKESLRVERVAKLEAFKEFVPMGLNFGEIAEEEFDKVLNGAKLQHDQKIAIEAENERIRVKAEKEAERLRLEKVEQEKLEQELIKADNIRLKEEAEQSKVLQDKADAERKAVEEKARKEKELSDADLKAEREENERLQKAIQDKADAERKVSEEAEKLRIAKEKDAEKLAKAPVKKQVKLWVEGFEIPESSIDNDVTKGIIEKFEAFKNWALLQTENI